MGNEEHWLFYNNKKYLMSAARQNANFSQLPEQFGTGYVKRLFSGPFAQIKDTQFTFGDNICGGVDYWTPRMVLYFCLDGGFSLPEENITVDPAKFLVFSATALKSVIFEPKLRHRIITIEISPERINGLGSNYSAFFNKFSAKTSSFTTHKMSPAIKTILHQLINCRYHDSILSLYMEGKLLEFLATYLNETSCQNKTVLDCPGLSRRDISSIYAAKQILDHNFVSPPTIAALTKQICLNEFKLKSGFKQLFGQTIHTYVVDKRLELARQLLEKKALNAGETASHVGYTNASYFALAFRKKYGVNPGEYSR